MALKDVIGEHAFVSKVDVSDLDASAAFYEKKLGLVPDEKFNTPTWRQFRVLPRVAIGLNVSCPPADSEQAVPWQRLSSMTYPDGNTLGLRQNSPQHPMAAAVGGA